MFRRAYLSAFLLASVPALPQAASPLYPGPIPFNDRMATPPPVSGEAYPISFGAEEYSNYLRGGMTFTTAYIDNQYPGVGRTIAETTYSILPTLDLDQTMPRRHFVLSYSPGFTFYQPSSELNEVDQTANLAYQVRLTPHSALHLSDNFQDSSTSFSSAVSAVGGSVSGSIPTIVPGVLAPFAKRLINSARGEYTLQFSRNSMIGAAGTATTLHYPDLSQAEGLFDSSSRGGSAFYEARMGARQYIGATYGYAQVLSYPTNAVSTAHIHTFLPFYSLYLSQTISFSISGGVQTYQVTETASPTFNSSSPSMAASLGWQGMHASFAASYSQSVTSGGGLLGAYDSKSANASLRRQMSRAWTGGLVASYSINKSASPLSLSEGQNGHSASGSAMVERALSRQIGIKFEYDRIHESYDLIQSVSKNPDADRASVSISWQLMRPLGR